MGREAIGRSIHGEVLSEHTLLNRGKRYTYRTESSIGNHEVRARLSPFTNSLNAGECNMCALNFDTWMQLYAHEMQTRIKDESIPDAKQEDFIELCFIQHEEEIDDSTTRELVTRQPSSDEAFQGEAFAPSL
jgi:hypothetical protein